MRRELVILGVVILSLGLLSLKYNRYGWTEKTTATISTPVVDIEMPAERRHTITIPPTVSWGGAVVGWLLVAVGLLAGGPPPGSSRSAAGPPRESG